MPIFNIRDVPDDIASAIDSAAKRQKRSRQEYLLERLVSEFGTERNATLAVTARLRELLSDLAECRSYHLQPKPTLARVAECIGLESTAPLDDLIRGDRPLSFAEADRICGLFGVDRTWLLDGAGHRFGMSPLFHEPWDLLKAMALGQLTWGEGKSYEELVFILPSAEMYCTAVFGCRDKTGYRIDLLLNNVPLYGGTGATGQGMIFDFCLVVAAVSEGSFRELGYGASKSSSYISASAEQHSGLVWGDLHVSCSRAELKPSRWVEDIWDLDYVRGHQHYPQAWREAYADFKEIAKNGHRITNNEELLSLIRRKIENIQTRAAEDFALERRLGSPKDSNSNPATHRRDK